MQLLRPAMIYTSLHLRVVILALPALQGHAGDALCNEIQVFASEHGHPVLAWKVAYISHEG